VHAADVNHDAHHLKNYKKQVDKHAHVINSDVTKGGLAGYRPNQMFAVPATKGDYNSIEMIRQVIKSHIVTKFGQTSVHLIRLLVLNGWTFNQIDLKMSDVRLLTTKIYIL